jgi:hypothetical protein
VKWRAGIQTNGKKEARHGLELVNAAAKQGSIAFEKNKMTTSRDGTDQMSNPGMMQGLGSADPNDRRAAGNYFSNLFVRNRVVGIVMQNFCGIDKLNGAVVPGMMQDPREQGLGDVGCNPEGQPQHAL